jgi:hypothetical protein
MLLVKLPVPLPSVVWLPAVVGLADVDQQTPKAVTAAPPSLLTVPPEAAEVAVMLDAAVVVTVGKTGATPVVKVRSSP